MEVDRPPQVTVVMPCHNGERTLEQSVGSAIAQTFHDWELIVIDDGSTDGSPELLQQFAADDQRIRILRNARASGAAAARNRGLEEARGRYIAFLDCDDAWLPHKLEVQIRAMQQQGAALACSAYDVMDGEGQIIGKVEPKPGVLTYRSMLGNNSVGCLTAIIDRSVCGEVRFNPSLPKGEDYQLWLSIVKRGLTAICLPDTLAVYRVHGNTLSSNKFSAARNRWRVYREFEQHGIITSAGYFCFYAVSGVWKMIFMRRGRFT